VKLVPSVAVIEPVLLIQFLLLLPVIRGQALHALFILLKEGWEKVIKIRAGIFRKSMGAWHRVGIGLSYRPARLNRLAELMLRNRLLGSINV
jgi:hypothetical protein